MRISKVDRASSYVNTAACLRPLRHIARSPPEKICRSILKELREGLRSALAGRARARAQSQLAEIVRGTHDRFRNGRSCAAKEHSQINERRQRNIGIRPLPYIRGILSSKLVAIACLILLRIRQFPFEK